MRSLLIVLAGACASAGTSFAVWAAIAMEPTVYCEIATGGLVRTNLPEHVVNQSVAEVLKETRPAAMDPDQRMVQSDYHEQARAWFSEAEPFGEATERAYRLVREQKDIGGGRTRIETLHGQDMPTLVFIEHEDEWRQRVIAELLAKRLESRGAEVL